VQKILGLERRQLDLEAGTLRLDPSSTKNDEGRVVYLTPELIYVLGEQLERIRAVERKTHRIIPYLFPHLSGPRRIGTGRRDFRKAWAKACEKAEVPGRLAMTCAGRRCGTWSTRACRNGWPSPSLAIGPGASSIGTIS